MEQALTYILREWRETWARVSRPTRWRWAAREKGRPRRYIFRRCRCSTCFSCRTRAVLARLARVTAHVDASSAPGQSHHFDRGPAPSGLPRSTDIFQTAPACRVGARSGHALVLKLGACLPSSIVPAIVNSNIKSWADAQRQPAPRARWLSSFGRRCGRSGNETGQATTASCAPLFEEGDENDCR